MPPLETNVVGLFDEWRAVPDAYLNSVEMTEDAHPVLRRLVSLWGANSPDHRHDKYFYVISAENQTVELVATEPLNSRELNILLSSRGLELTLYQNNEAHTDNIGPTNISDSSTLLSWREYF